MIDPAAPRISIGGILSMRGVYGVIQPAPDFSSVTPSTGKVAFRLNSPFGFQHISVGLMIVQMVSSDTIRVETFPLLNASTADFDSAASTYTR
jgi:hypothetical protein